MNFISITPFLPGKMDFVISEARRVAKASGITKNAYCMTLQPQNLDIMAKPRLYAKAFHQLKEALAGENLEIGILVQSLVGHGWNGRMICKQPMQYSINILGKTVYRHCMLDENFRKYVYDSIKMLAQEKPAFFLIDDDLRLLNNSANGPECFCPLHMKLYNQKMPRKFSDHTELREYLKKASADDPVVKIFEAEREKLLLDFAGLIRSAIDSVDDSIPCGYCAGGAEYVMMGKIARTLAGKNESFLRIHNALYMESDPKHFNMAMYHTSFCVDAAGNIDSILDESDTCPHDRFSKSAISMHSHIAGAILNGASGAKLWIANLLDDRPMTGFLYEKILKEHRGFYDALLAEVRQLKWQGAVTPLFQATERFNPADFRAGFYTWADWQVKMFNVFGIPGRFERLSGKDQVVMLTGDIIDYFDDEALKKVLSGKALVDGDAALKIAARGLQNYIGCDPVVKEYRLSEEILRNSGIHCAMLNNMTMPHLENIAPEAKILSDFFLGDFAAAPTGEIVGVGSFVYDNPFGGRVLVTALQVDSEVYNTHGPARKIALLDWLRELAPETLPVWATIDQKIYLRCGKRNAGGYLVGMVNLSFDTMEKIDLCCAFEVKKVSLLDGDGKWVELPFEVDGKNISIKKEMLCYETVILKLDEK